jgi:hypothetical protein
VSQPEYGSPNDPATRNGEWAVEERLRNQAIRNLKRRAAFRVHLLVYVLVNLLLMGIWLVGAIVSHEWAPWFLFPMLGWGIGLGIQAWTTYRGDELSEDRIRAEMARIATRR